MKNLQTYHDWQIDNEVNEFLKIESKRIESFLKDIKSKVKDARLVKTIEDTVNMAIVDPYNNFSKIMRDLKTVHQNNREVLSVINQYT